MLSQLSPVYGAQLSLSASSPLLVSTVPSLRISPPYLFYSATSPSVSYYSSSMNPEGRKSDANVTLDPLCALQLRAYVDQSESLSDLMDLDEDCQSHSTLQLPTCCERLLALSNPCWTLPVGCSLVHRGRVESTTNLYPAKGKVMAMSATTTSLEWPD